MIPSSRSKLAFGIMALFLLSLGGWAVLHRGLVGNRPTSVVLITVDTLRADHLSAYGYPRLTSPKFDAFAKEGILYRRAFAHASETNPSLSSLMTSHYPHETKVLTIYERLPEGAETIAEVLRAQGWRTGAVVSNDFLQRGSGFEQGFDDYDDRMADIKGNRPGPERGAEATTAAAIQWLRAHSDGRFFLWVHYMDPHAPYLPPAPYDAMFTADPIGESKKLVPLPENVWVGGLPWYAALGAHTESQYYVSQYDGEIRYMDYWLGELIEEMRSLRLLENTVVVITADHGEGMGEHEYYFSHAQFVYTGVIHVPLLLRLPGPARGGHQVDTPVALVDVMPTILEQLKLEGPKSLNGRSLLHPEPKPILAVARRRPVQVTLISDGLKLNYSEHRTQLYDLDHDFYETTDLLWHGTAERVQVAKTMRETFDRLLRQDALQLGAPEVWVTRPEDIQKLKTLGYVQ